jgi:hypothetical protein
MCSLPRSILALGKRDKIDTYECRRIYRMLKLVQGCRR